MRVHIGAAPGGAFFVGDSVRRWVLGLGPGLMPATRAVRRPPLRLTRRGRIVFTLLLIAVAATAVVLIAAPAGRAADPPAPRPTVVVQHGETLWMIAERYSPRRDRFATIEEIRRLNGLDGYGVRAGQRLVMPRAR